MSDRKSNYFRPVWLFTAATLIGTQAMAFEGVVSPETVAGEKIYSPFVGRSFPDQVLFGDLHFHTEISFDAGLIGT